MSQKFAKPFRTILQSILPHRSKANTFLNVPPEIVDEVFALLPGADQICFSLSCRYAFACFQIFLERHGIRAAEILPRSQRPIINSTRSARSELLLRLQNSRWVYCSQCWSLHRYSVWHALQSNWKLYQRPCTPTCDVARSGKCSLPYAGEVDICPCSRLTFHQRQHLDDFARCPDKLMAPGAYESSYNHRTDTTITHECVFRGSPLAHVEVSSRIWAQGRPKMGLMLNMFKFEFYRPDSPESKLLLKPLLHCHPYLPKEWLQNFFSETSSDFFFGRNPAGYHCYLLTPHMAPDGRFVFWVFLSRNLGNRRWPSSNWKFHRRPFLF